MYYISRVPSFPASVTCDLCSLSDGSVLWPLFFFQIVSFPEFDLTKRKKVLKTETQDAKQRNRVWGEVRGEGTVGRRRFWKGGKNYKETANVSTHQALSHLLRCIELNVERVVVLSQQSNWSPRERNRETALWQKSTLSRTWPTRISLGETVCFFLNLQYLQVHRGLWHGQRYCLGDRAASRGGVVWEVCWWGGHPHRARLLSFHQTGMQLQYTGKSKWHLCISLFIITVRWSRNWTGLR